ncbi:MAG: hypothetical protein GYB66_03335, partial [Chloroflexi bacterium]|nr:hypothetical protein [Chloroflexota bacterium]
SRILGQLQAVWIGVSCLWAITIFPLLILFFVFSDMLIRGVLLIMIGIWLWGFLRAGLSIRQQHSIVRADLEAGKAAVAEGILSKRVEGRNCFLTVGGIEVPVPKAAFDHAPTSQTVALYYLPQSQQILSLAVLGEPTPAAEEEDQTV